jgi:signal transduction histidine kinase
VPDDFVRARILGFTWVGGNVNEFAIDDEKTSSLLSSTIVQGLSLLNALLTVSLENIPLERQLLSALESLLTVPWLCLYPRAALFLLDEGSDVLQLAASIGLPDAVRLDCAQVPLGHCICGHVAATGAMFCSGCVSDRNAACYKGMPHYSVPLRHCGKTLGVLTLYPKEGRACDPESALFLDVAATTVIGIIVKSRAIEHAQRLLGENRQLNQRLIALQEEEYRHLARELHDEIGQSVAAIKTEAALLARASASDEMRRDIQTVSAAADRIYEVMQEKVRRLRPGMLDDLGLSAAVEALVAEWRRRRPAVSCRLDVQGPLEDLDEATKITIYRFVQECLTNIVRHSVPTEVTISLSREAGVPGLNTRGTIVLSVSDNGRGADVARLRESRGRFGLLAMRERVDGLGGTLTIESAPDQGFRLTANIPLMERRKT